MKSVNIRITPELYHGHNINFIPFIQQIEIFFECGKAGLRKPHNRNGAKKHDREISKLKRIIGEITITDDALKNVSSEHKNESHDNNAKTKYQYT